jgi:hypothetical protein
LRSLRRRSSWPICGGLVIGIVAACGGHLPGRATPEPTLDQGDRPHPTEIAPIETAFAGDLPRSAEFAGLRFTVAGATISNLHPYPMFSDDPTEFLFGILDLQVQNVSGGDVSYSFGEESFFLRTWSGDLLAEVHHPGTRRFDGLAPGESATDTVAFGLPDAAALDGALLLIGESPDAAAAIALTGIERPVDLPRELQPVGPPAAHVGPIEWTVVAGGASLDRPADVPQTATGDRADAGEAFVQLTLRGMVSGSQYGQASITSEEVRLVVDAVEIESLQFRGEANVPEGQSIDMLLGFLTPYPFEAIEARFSWTGGLTGSVHLALEALP